MKTTSSPLMKGVVIAVILLACAQALRNGRLDVAAPLPEGGTTASTPEAPTPALPSRHQSASPSQNSIEFVKPLEQPHDPWKNRTDPDHVWHNQRERASELMIRLDLPPLER